MKMGKLEVKKMGKLEVMKIRKEVMKLGSYEDGKRRNGEWI